MLRIFIGVDRNEMVAYHVLANSLMRHSSIPLAITPLILSQLPLNRPRAEYQSTEFSFSRFLVPYLCGYRGTAIFADCDMLCRTDIAELDVDPHKAVSVVQHDYTAKDANKFLDQQQSLYAKKNWSSLMVFNNAMCDELTPKVVNESSGLYLHQFKWLEDESLIGDIPLDWNHLVGEYAPNPAAKLVHFTLGTPCFRAYNTCEYAREWYDEKRLMLDYNQVGEFAERADSAA